MKRIPALLMSLVSVALLWGIASAETVTIQNHNSLYQGGNQCNGGTFEQVVYLGNQNHTVMDTLYANEPSYVYHINMSDSWVSQYNIIPGILTLPTMYYYSNLKPHNVYKVIVMRGPDGAQIGSSLSAGYQRSQIASQLVYHIKRTRYVYSAGNQVNGSFWDYDNQSAGIQSYNYTPLAPAAPFVDNECLNIHIGFCGDGIIDNSSINSSTSISASLNGGEECDPEHPNYKNKGTCTADCKLIPTPMCNSSYHTQSVYNPNYPSPRLTSNMSLCNPGEVISLIGPNGNGMYTRGCKVGSITTPNDNCRAKDLRCGDGVKNGPEECDPNDPTHAGWGTGGCGSDCKPANPTPACNSNYHGQSSYNPNFPTPRLNSNMPLCNPGEVISLVGPNAQGLYTRGCKSGNQSTSNTACQAQDLRCGDGIKNGPEECDPNDPTHAGWGAGGCGSDCKSMDPAPACNSVYHGKVEYNPNYPSPRLTSNMPLCNPGEVISLVGPNGHGIYTRGCKLGTVITPSTACKAYDLRCGDGIKNGPEECDPNDPNHVGWGTEGCSKDCKKTPSPGDPTCNPVYHGQTVYNSDFPSPRLNTSMPLCNPGEVISLVGPNVSGLYTWGCKVGGVSTSNKACKAQDLRCGDGIKNGPEECDPNDSTHAGWGAGGCSEICEKIIIPPPGDPACNPNYNGQSSYNPNYPSPRLTSNMPLCNPGEVIALVGPNTQGLYTRGCKVGDKFTSDDECQARDKRCGDGIKNGPEQCDPNDPTHAGWGTEGCSSDCKPVNPAAPACNLNYHNQTVYNPNFPTPRLNSSMPLCNPGEVVSLIGPSSSGLYTRGCKLGNVVTVGDKCKAQDLRCGDGIKNGPEECDPNDPTHVGWGTEGCSSACKKIGEDQGLIIDKNILENRTYAIGEEVGFKMVFKNYSSTVAKNVIIRDTLPQNLEYVSSFMSGQFVGTSPISSGLYLSGGLNILEYSGFNLAPNQEGILFMTGKVKSSYLADRINTVCIFDDKKMGPRKCDQETYKLDSQVIKIVKDVDKPYAQVGDLVEFTIKVTNGAMPYSQLTITDTLPVGLVYTPDSQIISESSVPFESNFEQDGQYLKRILRFPQQFKKDDFFVIKIKAKVTAYTSSYYTNIACIDIPEKPCDPEDVHVYDSSDLKIKKYVNNVIEDTNRADDSMQFSKNATAYFTLEVSDATRPFTGFRIEDTIEGNLLYLDSLTLPNNAFTGVMIFSYDRELQYTITPIISSLSSSATKIVREIVFQKGSFVPGDRLIIKFKAQVKGNQGNIAHLYFPQEDGTEGHRQDPASVTVSSGGGGGGGWTGGGGKTPKCGDGYRNGMEFCDLGGEGVIGSDGKLFSKEEIYDLSYAGSICTSTCTVVNTPACFNTQNGSISIMRNEVLPFYFNLEGVLKKDITNPGYETDLKNHFFLAPLGTDLCSEEDVDKIDLRSMSCTFTVYGPGAGNTNAIFTFQAPCMSLDGWSRPGSNNFYPRIASFVAQNKNGRFGGSILDEGPEIKNVFSSLDDAREKYPTLLPLSSKLLIRNFGTPQMKVNEETVSSTVSQILKFGEYKLSREKLDFQYCAPAGKDTAGNQIYKLTEYQDGYPRVCEVNFAVTDHYLIQNSPFGIGKNAATIDLNSYALKNGTTFMETFSSLKISAEDYAIPMEMSNLYDTFKAKYEKIALRVENSNLYKVPGKSIYLVDGNGSINFKNIMHNRITSTPFTLIAKNNQDIVIQGNIMLTNAMIMTKGKIIFDAEGSCNGQDGYYQAGQRVQGIFYAEKGFGSINHEKLKNTVANLNEDEWCNYGNLHIKGVAMGDLSEVIKERRSELYDRFEGFGGGSYGLEKMNKVIKGASILVEYHPDLWRNLPPGAEEFSKILEIYRK